MKEKELRTRLNNVNYKIKLLRYDVDLYEKLIDKRVDIKKALRQVLIFGENDEPNYLAGKYFVTYADDEMQSIRCQLVEKCEKSGYGINVIGDSYILDLDVYKWEFEKTEEFDGEKSGLVYDINYIDFAIISPQTFDSLRATNNLEIAFEILQNKIETFLDFEEKDEKKK